MAVVGGCSTKKKTTRFDLWHGEEKGKKKKENMPIFRSRLYSSGWAYTLRPVPPYIGRFLIKTDEYKFIFVGFRINEYNLNIFVGTDEFKTLTNE
jgi:hypothetical protein